MNISTFNTMRIINIKIIISNFLDFYFKWEHSIR